MKPSKKDDATETEPAQPATGIDEGTSPDGSATERSEEANVDDQAKPDDASRSPEEEAPSEGDQSSTETTARTPRQVMIGSVRGMCVDMAVASVLDQIGQMGRDRIAAFDAEPAILDRAKRALANDGRYTPTVFTVNDDGDASLFYGYENIAAAKASGHEIMPVLLIDAKDAGAVQSFLSAKVMQNGNNAADDDDLIFRAYSDDDD